MSLYIEFYSYRGLAYSNRKFQLIMEKVQHVMTVSLSGDFVAMITYSMIKDIRFAINCWKRVVLNMGPYHSCIGGVYGLLRNSTFLEELTLDLSQRCCGPLLWEIKEVLKGPMSVQLSEWNSHVHDYICLRQHLKQVTMR